MSRTISRTFMIISAVLLCATPLVAATPDAVQGSGITLKNTSITFPASARLFPGGAPAEAINNNCLTCHSASMVFTQPHLSKDDWEKEVVKMKKVYGAPLADADMPAIVAYLAAMPAAK